ncbi:SHF isoform 11, partial [Pan troglodytes]
SPSLPDGDRDISGPASPLPEPSLEDSSAQFEGPEKSCLSPGREEKGRLPPRLSAGNPKSAKPLSMEPSSPLGEWTDPALPLENQVWYHGAISRTDAENLLRLCKEASYLLSYSRSLNCKIKEAFPRKVFVKNLIYITSEMCIALKIIKFMEHTKQPVYHF